MANILTPADLIALATRIRALEQIAFSADMFLNHIKGFRLHTDNGIVDVFNEYMPEAIALQAALDAWHQLQGKPEQEQAS